MKELSQIYLCNAVAYVTDERMYNRVRRHEALELAGNIIAGGWCEAVASEPENMASLFQGLWFGVQGCRWHVPRQHSTMICHDICYSCPELRFTPQ